MLASSYQIVVNSGFISSEDVKIEDVSCGDALSGDPTRHLDFLDWEFENGDLVAWVMVGGTSWSGPSYMFSEHFNALDISLSIYHWLFTLPKVGNYETIIVSICAQHGH